MRIFAETPKATQQATSFRAAERTPSHLGHSHAVNSILHLQRRIGNQAVKRRLQINAEERNAELTSTASPQFGHDFSRIPVSPPTAGAIQMKLTIDTPGDEYEQEADRIALQINNPSVKHVSVNHRHFPQISRRSEEETGDELDLDPQDDLETTEDELQFKRMNTTTRPSAFNHAVLSTSGDALSKSSKNYFEAKFNHDFSHVRIHHDQQAAQSASSVAADAYTYGNHIVFNRNNYQPDTHQGKHLLAHELTHVIQQQKNPALNRKVIQRRYSKKRVNAIYKQVNPQPSPPIIKRSLTALDVIRVMLQLSNHVTKILFNTNLVNPNLLKQINIPQYELGPFRCWPYDNKKIYDIRTNKPVKNLGKQAKELLVEEDFNGRTIIKHHDFIHKILKQKPNSTASDMKQYIFGFTKASKSQIGAETMVFHKTNSSLNWERWSNIGKITPANSSNPFYDWAAMLHETHHKATAEAGFTNKVRAEILKMKNKILATPVHQFKNYKPHEVIAMQSQLIALTDPEIIFNFMRKHPIIRFEANALQPKINTLYNKWETYFSQVKNYAKEELAAYCLSWKGIHTAIRFIKMALSYGKRRVRRPGSKRP